MRRLFYELAYFCLAAFILYLALRLPWRDVICN